LPERIAALSSRVTAKLGELGGTLRPSREPQSDAGSNCEVLLDIACACYQIGDDSTDRSDMEFWYGFGESVTYQYIECIGG
jgi:hypothetical protein